MRVRLPLSTRGLGKPAQLPTWGFSSLGESTGLASRREGFESLVLHVRVDQLVRSLSSQGRGCGFESHHGYASVAHVGPSSCLVNSRTQVRFLSEAPRPHLLTVRKPGFHPGNRSSILRGVTCLLIAPRRRRRRASWAMTEKGSNGRRTG